MILPTNLERFDQLEQLQEAAASAFCTLVAETLRTADTFRVSLSGGSTPKRIYELISQRDLPWDRIHWFWGDERNVAYDDNDSNARMVQDALLRRINLPEQNIHLVPVDIGNPAAAAAAYEQELRSHFPGDRFPCWDLNLLGMGDDGHTASLFPGTSALQETDRWFVENWVEKFNAYRYTLTAPAINSARQIWFLVAGAAKKEALTNVVSKDRVPNLYPSQLIRPDRWFVTSDTID